MKVNASEGWQCYISLTKACRQDLAELCRKLPGLNGHPIRSLHTAVALTTIFGKADSFIVGRAIPAHKKEDGTAIVAGDASATDVCSYTISSKEEFYHQSQLTAEEKTFSSGHRELVTVSRTLQTCGKKLARNGSGVTVYWVTDSTNLVAFLTKGSPKEAIQKEAIAAYRAAQQNNHQLIPIHTRRENPRHVIAVDGSKNHDNADRGNDLFYFIALRAREGPCESE